MYDEDFQSEEIHQTLQLKINYLLNKPFKCAELTNQQYFVEITEQNNLLVYFCDNQLKSYHQPYVIANAQRLSIVKDPNMMFRQILAQGRNMIYLYTKKHNENSPPTCYQIPLSNNEQIVFLSETIEWQNMFITILMTNFGTTYLCSTKDNHLQILQILNSTILPAKSLLKTILLPFTSPPRIYQYVKCIPIHIQSSYYYLHCKQLTISWFILGNRFLQEKKSLWSVNLEKSILKNNQKILLVWNVSAFVKKDQLTIISGVCLQKQQGDIKPFIFASTICWCKGQLIITQQIQLEIQGNFQNSQLMIVNDNIYLLIKNTIEQGCYSENSKLMIFSKDLVLKNDKAFKKASLCSGKQNILLLTETEAYKISQQNRQLRQYQQNNESFERIQQIKRQSFKQIQKELLEKNFNNIYKILRQQQNKFNQINQRSAEREKPQLQDIIIRIKIVKEIVNLKIYHNISIDFKQHESLLTDYDVAKIFDQLEPMVVAKILNSVFISYSSKYIEHNKNSHEINFTKYICDNFSYSLNACFNHILNYSQPWQDQFIQNYMYFISPSIQEFQKLLKKRKEQLLLNLLKIFNNENIFIVLYCYTDLLKHKKIASFIQYLIKASKTKEQILQFMVTFLDHYFISLKDQSSSNCKDLSILEYPVMQSFYKDIYQYLLQNHSNIAWIVGLKLNIRKPQQICMIAETLDSPEHVHSMLKVVSDMSDQQYAAEQVMAKICISLKKKYLSTSQLIAMGQENNLNEFFKGNKISKQLWSQLMKKSSNSMKQDLKNIEKSIQFK